jgi:hypothetical protein
MVKCGVLFEVRTGFLNIVLTSFLRTYFLLSTNLYQKVERALHGDLHTYKFSPVFPVKM